MFRDIYQDAADKEKTLLRGSCCICRVPIRYLSEFLNSFLKIRSTLESFQLKLQTEEDVEGDSCPIDCYSGDLWHKLWPWHFLLSCSIIKALKNTLREKSLIHPVFKHYIPATFQTLHTFHHLSDRFFCSGWTMRYILLRQILQELLMTSWLLN